MSTQGGNRHTKEVLSRLAVVVTGDQSRTSGFQDSDGRDHTRILGVTVSASVSIGGLASG
jgi:hypothetical protein